MNIRTLMRMAGADCTEAAAEVAADSAESYIRAYCGINDIPCALERIALSMASALLRQSGADGAEGVKAVRVGDTQVEFCAADPAAALSVCRAYDAILNRYRRVRWR